MRPLFLSFINIQNVRVGREIVALLHGKHQNDTYHRHRAQAGHPLQTMHTTSNHSLHTTNTRRKGKGNKEPELLCMGYHDKLLWYAANP